MQNIVLFENSFASLNQVYQNALNQVEEFQSAYQEANQTESKIEIRTQIEVRRWKKPVDHCLKANSDASVHTQTNSIGLGGIIRDYDGEVHATVCIHQTSVQYLEVVEAFTLRKLMHINDELDLNHITFEGDYLLMVKYANLENKNQMKIGLVIHSIQFS